MESEQERYLWQLDRMGVSFLKVLTTWTFDTKIYNN